MTSVLATSVIDVQLCGTSSGAGMYARLPASSGLPNAIVMIEFASRRAVRQQSDRG